MEATHYDYVLLLLLLLIKATRGEPTHTGRGDVGRPFCGRHHSLSLRGWIFFSRGRVASLKKSFSAPPFSPPTPPPLPPLPRSIWRRSVEQGRQDGGQHLQCLHLLCNGGSSHINEGSEKCLAGRKRGMRGTLGGGDWMRVETLVTVL